MILPACSDCGAPITQYSRGRCRDCANAYVAETQRGQPIPVTDISHAAAEIGSKSLLRRQLATGQHNIVDPVLFWAACEAARG